MTLRDLIDRIDVKGEDNIPAELLDADLLYLVAAYTAPDGGQGIIKLEPED